MKYLYALIDLFGRKAFECAREGSRTYDAMSFAWLEARRDSIGVVGLIAMAHALELED